MHNKPLPLGPCYSAVFEGFLLSTFFVLQPAVVFRRPAGEGHVMQDNMKIAEIPEKDIVKSGTYLYGGSVLKRVIIVRSDYLYGTGDHEDEPEISEDLEVEAYYVWFESLVEDGHFNVSSGGYVNLVDATKGAESSPGVGPTIVWQSA